MANAADKKPRTHLHDMAIHTIAFVDRGANSKRWIVAKIADDQAPEAQPIDQPPPVPAPPVANAPHEPPPAVVKGDIVLAEGESLEEFKEGLCEALCALLNPGNIDSRRVWLRAVYADHVIAQQGWDMDENLLSLPYTREAAGFKFGDASMVEEVTTYEPAAKNAPPAPEPSAEDLEKSKRSAAERLSRMWATVSTLHDMVKELVAEVTAPPVPKPAPAAEPDPMAVMMADLQRKQREQDEELARLRKIHSTSNSIPVDGEQGSQAPFSWPMDMNDLRKNRAGERGQ